MTMMEGIIQQDEAEQRHDAGLPDVSLVIGRYGDATTGARLLCVGGLHGNEPAGVYALQRAVSYTHLTLPTSFSG